MDFEAQLQRYRRRIERALPEFLPGPESPPAELHKAMHYCLGAGGKRLRPTLVLATADLFPGSLDATAAAVAVEYLHTYTLVHDDLPSMDDSPLRRGKAATHIAFSEATAILAGDALLTESFNLLAKAYKSDPPIAVALIHTLGQASGSQCLIGGQAVDTSAAQSRLCEEDMHFVHEHKTADLLVASLQMGLICGKAPPEALHTARDLGYHLGLAFQIVDDILDATSSPEVLGKTAGNDAHRATNTFVSLFGLEESRRRAAHHTEKALDFTRQLHSEAHFLETLVDRLLVRTH